MLALHKYNCIQLGRYQAHFSTTTLLGLVHFESPPTDSANPTPHTTHSPSQLLLRNIASTQDPFACSCQEQSMYQTPLYTTYREQ